MDHTIYAIFDTHIWCRCFSFQFHIYCIIHIVCYMMLMIVHKKKNTIMRKWSITRLIQLTTIQIISFKQITTKKIWENETKYSQKQNKKIAKWFLTSLGSDLCANRSNSYLAHFSWIRFWVNPFSQIPLSILIYFSDYNLSSLIGIISLA